jgi:hypothetical protein
MSDKLQFVAAGLRRRFHFFQSACGSDRDKLKFVGHRARIPLINKGFYLHRPH